MNCSRTASTTTPSRARRCVEQGQRSRSLASTDRALQGFVLDVYDYEGLLLTLIDHAREDALSRALWSDVGALIEAKRLRLVAANFIPLMTPSSITLVINSSVDGPMILLLGFIGTEDDGSCLHPLAHAQHLETLDVSGWYRLTSANMEIIISSCHPLSRLGPLVLVDDE